MAQRFCVLICLLILGALSSAAQERGSDKTSPGALMGTWSGTWEGMGSSGGFELTLEKGKDDALGGRVSVTGEPTYKATLKTLGFDGNKMKATYDFPPDDSLEVVLATAFDGGAATGTWVARGKQDGNELASGTWSVKKK